MKGGRHVLRLGKNVPVFSALCMAVLFLAATAGTGGAGDAAGLVGKNAPMFSTIDLDGKPMQFAEVLQASSLVVLNFWGVRCGSCLEEMPHLSGMHARYLAQKVKILGVNVDGLEPAKLKSLLPQVAAVPPYPLLVDQDFKITDLYAVSAAPLTFIVLPNGKIVYQHEGFTAGDERKLEEEIVKFLKSDAVGK